MGKDVLIIGAGPAGLAAAEAAAARGAVVTLCGEEPYAPYWRPRLTRCLAEPERIEALAIKKPEWYEKTGIQLLTGKKAAHIDTTGRSVQFSDGSELKYDSLVIAAGSAANRPEIAGLGQAYTLRGYDDALSIRAAALAAGRAVVVGGGLLGLETAWELSRAEVQVALVERNRWLMPRQMNRAGGQYLQRRLEAAGLSLVIGRDPSELRELYDGACVVLAAGVCANLAWLNGSGVAVGRAVTVDNRMKTSIDGIFACGDAAEFEGRCWGLLPVAQQQGAVAGANAAGADERYTEVPPSPMLKVGAVSVFSVGDVSEGEGVTVLSRENEAGYACLMLRDGVLAGAVLVGDTKAGMALKKAVAEKKKVTDQSSVDAAIASLIGPI